MIKTTVKIGKSTRDLKKLAGDIILVPVDFSDHSAAAVVMGAKLTKCNDESLVVLHVVHDPAEMQGYYQKLMKKKKNPIRPIQDFAEDLFNDFMKKVIDDNHGLKHLSKANKLMVTGLPVTRILEVINRVEPKMVVIGSRGLTGLKHLLIGSLAEKLVHLCPVPITVVKNGEKGR
ncbi:MAG: universal stress protein [Pseudomonadota bacterium]|nr:universal stress protein [Pseudomonadota bacterium]